MSVFLFVLLLQLSPCLLDQSGVEYEFDPYYSNIGLNNNIMAVWQRTDGKHL